MLNEDYLMLTQIPAILTWFAVQKAGNTLELGLSLSADYF